MDVPMMGFSEFYTFLHETLRVRVYGLLLLSGRCCACVGENLCVA